jgi:hypothetical protein
MARSSVALFLASVALAAGLVGCGQAGESDNGVREEGDERPGMMAPGDSGRDAEGGEGGEGGEADEGGEGGEGEEGREGGEGGEG